MDKQQKTVEECSLQVIISKRDSKHEEKAKKDFNEIQNTLISNLSLNVIFENLHERKNNIKISKLMSDNNVKTTRIKFNPIYEKYDWKYLGKSRYEINGNLAREIHSLVYYLKNDIFEARSLFNQVYIGDYIFQNFNNITYWFLNLNAEQFTREQLYFFYCLGHYFPDKSFNFNSTNTVQSNPNASIVSDSNVSNMNCEDFQSLQNYISEYFVNVHNYDFQIKKKEQFMLVLPDFNLVCKYREIFHNSEYRLNQYQENNLIFFLESLLLCLNKKITSIVFTLKFETEDLKILKIVLLKLVKFTQIVFILKIDKIEIFKELIKNEVIDKIKEYFINSSSILSFKLFILHDYSVAAEYFYKNYCSMLLMLIAAKSSKLRKLNRRKNILFSLKSFLNNSYSKKYFTQILEMENEKKNDDD